MQKLWQEKQARVLVPRTYLQMFWWNMYYFTGFEYFHAYLSRYPCCWQKNGPMSNVIWPEMSQETNGSPISSTWRPKEAMEAVTTTHKRRSLSLVASLFRRSNSLEHHKNPRSNVTKSQNISKTATAVNNTNSNIWTIEIPSTTKYVLYSEFLELNQADIFLCWLVDEIVF